MATSTEHRASTSTEDGSPETAEPAPPSPSARLARGVRRLGSRAHRTTPRLVRGLTALSLAALLGLGATATAVLVGARDGTDTIGHRAAPQATRAADLYFALSDMDAQAANLLLVGADPDYTALREQTLDTYERRRAQADDDLQQAAQAAADDPAGQRAVQLVLGRLGSYEALVARAQLLEEQAGSPAGQPSQAALETYRQATDLLRRQLLPAADQVTVANDASVERVYQQQRDDLGSGRWWLLAVGLLALVVLFGLQRLLAVRYRRVVNPALAAVTLLTGAVLVTGLNLVGRAEDHLVTAKRNAYDSVIALSRARAVAYDMNADESRYLIDPARAVAYEQAFLEQTQAIARIDGATLADYDARLADAARRHRADHAAVPFGGYLGSELRNVTFAGEREAAERVLDTFQQYQTTDRRIRELRGAGKLKEAVTLNTGLSKGQSNYDFEQLGDAIGDTIAINATAMDRAVAATDGDLDGTTAALAAGALAVALGLTAAGVRPRLREYR
ncbi:hypothetical protein GCM10018790_81290 [Kitasatospora xanthocidica]|uniref:hypothetical protein n=1 Tax=Kitasatospora xanthocidica TaxID=83382 RepID=UPI001673DE3F|nr:hypothetical protein [Kitasatospora xanthocidica]GHF91979.1 hypothetical protein GCM10018790_81290 [Kitasatospora xanthocidica]